MRLSGARPEALGALRVARSCRRVQHAWHLRAASDASPFGAAPVVPLEEQRRFRKDTLAGMVKFMMPALLIPMADPIMGVIDTICIGQVMYMAGWSDTQG